MKSILKVLALVYFISNLFSCGPILYSNVGQNVPLFQEKGEFSGQVSFSASDGSWSASGIGLQGAYSISDKVAAIGSYYSMKDDDPSNQNEWEGSGSHFEFGVGLFGGKPEKKIQYEGFLGMGLGSINNKSLVTPGDFFNVNYLKPFIQPSIAFSTKYFELAVTPRIAYLTYTSQDDYNIDQNTEQVDPREFFNKSSNTLILEPGIMLRGGFPRAKLELQYNFSTLREPFERFSVINNSFFSLGLRFLIADRTSSK